jgi:transcriptional regulator with XRE-family HTH domain
MDASFRLRIKLRLVRQGLLLTQQDLADKLGISLRTYQRLEAGQTPLDAATVINLCDKLNYSFLDFTHPNLNASECNDTEFFNVEKDFYIHEDIHQKSFEEVKPVINEEKLNLLKVLESPSFHAASAPLMVADTSITVANDSLLKIAPRLDERKWKTMSKWDNLNDQVKAWDICLKDDYMGFHSKCAIKSDKTIIPVRSFNLMLKSDEDNPILIRQIVTL